MKSLTLFAALVVLSGGMALAQQDMGRSSVAGAGYTTGVVELFDSNSMTLREDSDRVVTILIVKGTVGADHELVGSRVRVTFHHNDSNQAIADEIQAIAVEAPAQVVAAAPAYTPTTAPTPAPTVTEKNAYTPPPAYTPAPSTETKVAATLPHTASPLAAIGLLGLLSLGGAMIIRFIR